MQAWGGAAQKPGWGAGAGVKWPGVGGSGPGSGADLETPKTQLYQHGNPFCLHVLCIFFAFFLHLFCISQTGSHFFLASFLHFPNRESFFCIFLHFLDRVCHLHHLPDPDEKTTRMTKQ